MPERLKQSASPSAEIKITPEKWKNSLDYYRTHREILIEAARLARDKGVSYRNPPFLVGYAAMGVEQDGEYVFHSSHNLKPNPEVEKRCAEDGAINAALKDGSFLTVALVGVSREIYTGGEPNGSHDVLHPCKKCRNMFRKLIKAGILRNESIICNVNDAERPGKEPHDIIEERTVGELLAMYKDDKVE